MTAAVPDPRFRDQLAEDLAQFIASYTRGERAWARMSDTARDIYRGGAKTFVADALLPLIAAKVEALRKRAEEAEIERDYWKTETIELTSQWPDAAEVEARVQAAANQRAAEAVKPGLSVESNGRRLAWFTDDELAAELNRRGAAALASPAPAPRAEEGPK